MQVQNQRRSRPGAIIVLVLLIGLDLLAIWQYPPRREPVTQAPTTAGSQRPALKPFVITLDDDVSADDHGNELRRFSDAAPNSLRPISTGRESAELHNLYRMRTYQDRVIRVLHSRTPVFPNTMAPTFEELLLENADAD